MSYTPEQLREIAHAIDFCYGEELTVEAKSKHAGIIRAHAAALEELATLREDAERYRWLRDTDTAVVSWFGEDGIHWSITGRDGHNITRDRLDAAIDAAREKP